MDLITELVTSPATVFSTQVSGGRYRAVQTFLYDNERAASAGHLAQVDRVRRELASADYR